MNYLFDTNIVICFLKNDPGIIANTNKIDKMNMSIISVGEMLYGAENSANKEANYNLYLSFFEICTILPIDFEVAKMYAKIRYTLKNMGKPIPENDVWIAATAKTQNLTLVTRDSHLLEIGEVVNVEEW